MLDFIRKKPQCCRKCRYWQYDQMEAEQFCFHKKMEKRNRKLNYYFESDKARDNNCPLDKK